MNTFLDHYCERIDSISWSEPFNIFSNLAFIVVAYLLYVKTVKLHRTFNRSIADIWILTEIVFLIGLGSAAWHILAQHWALWADRIPILVFISLFILSCLVRVLSLSLTKAFVIFFVFHLVNSLILTMLPASTLNGSLFYIPTGVLLFAITLILWYQKSMVKHFFLLGSLIFIAAIVFRTIDLSICNAFPVGTHFIWHLLIAITIYLLMSGLINTVQLSEKNIPTNET